ncbi:MAG: c-type cytochrome [Proteobacteria bacterium]|nr:c-type cytochrome [Pseudomonadota bacterium]MCP4917964.1 c-type cytochrome [Pseudomonadota bacterium]
MSRLNPWPYVLGAGALVVLSLVDAAPSFGWFELSSSAAVALGVGKVAALLSLVLRFLSDRGAPRALVGVLSVIGVGIGVSTVFVLEQGPEVELISNVPAGEALYSTHCASCHGFGGQGTERGVSLIDDEWLHGSTETDVAVTIAAGVPGTTMIAWGPEIGEGYAPLLAEYVLSLDRTDAP